MYLLLTKSQLQVSPTHYLDATSIEETATPLRLLLLFSFQKDTTRLQGVRLLGPGEANVSTFTPLLRVRLHTCFSRMYRLTLEQQGETYARELSTAFKVKLEAELSKRNRKQKGLNSR